MEEKIYRVKVSSAFLITDETRDLDDELFTPDGGVTYDIVNPDGVLEVDGAAMAEISTGIWRASVQSESDWVLGMYALVTYAVHGGKTSIKENKNAFELY